MRRGGLVVLRPPRGLLLREANPLPDVRREEGAAHGVVRPARAKLVAQAPRVDPLREAHERVVVGLEVEGAPTEEVTQALDKHLLLEARRREVPAAKRAGVTNPRGIHGVGHAAAHGEPEQVIEQHGHVGVQGDGRVFEGRHGEAHLLAGGEQVAANLGVVLEGEDGVERLDGGLLGGVREAPHEGLLRELDGVGLALGGGDGGLTDRGRDFVRALNARKIFVDLAHISRRGFFDALAVHDKSQPVLVTHTGVTGVTPHWRNIDDAQLRAVADLGGTVGVMYQSSFVGDPNFGGRSASIVKHLAHIVDTVGEDYASLGSDWDGMIVTPRDMPTCMETPRLVQHMLDRGWSDTRIQKVLGGNFLRVVAALRG